MQDSETINQKLHQLNLQDSSKSRPLLLRLEMNTSSPLLDLPLNIRAKIYSLAGLIRDCPIELTQPYAEPDTFSGRGLRMRGCLYTYRKAGGDYGLDAWQQDCVCPRLPTQLLLLRRSIHREASEMFYSRNKFIIRAHSAADFASLHHVSQRNLALMTSLFIRIGCRNCPRGHEVTLHRVERCATCNTSLQPGRSLFLHGRDIFAEWSALCHRLKLAISSRRLKFTLICDVSSLAIGQQFLEPLSHLPTLRACTIRLGHAPDYELSILAQETSQKATDVFIPYGPFPFERLPKELRLHILSYTDLGQSGAYTKKHEELQIRERKLVNGTGDLSRSWNRKCCTKCTETLVDCCCTASRAAYSADCKCRYVPFELLYVNKQMHQEALQTLYSQNCFSILQYPADTLAFFSRFSKEALSSIRQLHFTLPEMDLVNWTERGFLAEWKLLTEYMSAELDVSRLQITVEVNTFDMGCFTDDADETRPIYDVYRDLVRAFRLMRGVQDIRFDVGWFIMLEPIMAKGVMGENHIDRHPGWDFSEEQRKRQFFKLPAWYKETDFTGDL